MTEIQSYIFDFKRVKDFFEQWNIKFKVSEMNGANNFELVLASYSPSNIDECLTSNGTLNANVTDTIVANLGLVWSNYEIRVANNVTFTIGDSTVPIKSVFVRHKNSGYVMGYCINQNAFNVTNQVIFDKDTIIWAIFDGEVNG